MTDVSHDGAHSTEFAHRMEAGARGSSALLLALLVAAALIVAANAAHAALYKWTDARGVTHYSDKLPVDAVDRASYQLNRGGLTIKKTEEARPVVQRIPRTASEEQQVRDAERERVIAERRDRALIESYTNESEIDLAKTRALATIDGQVQSSAALINQLTKRRAELQSTQATYAPRPAPGSIAREIETIDAEVARQNEFIDGKKKESEAVAARYDADKQRFHELRNGQSSGSTVTSTDGRTSSTAFATIELTSAH